MIEPTKIKPEMAKAMKWRLIQSGFLDGYANMAIDEAMFTLSVANCIPPTLRLYGWKPPAVSIGYFQKAEEINQEKGVDIVRRLTGGGAILHNQELTFCLVTALRDSIIPEDISASYNVICRAIITGLQFLGVDAKIRGNDYAGRRAADKEEEPFFCFARPSKYDIIYKGKKLVGSAQRRKNGILLHHGSILLNEQKLDGSTSISSILGRKVELEELSTHIVQGFEKELSIDLVPGELTKDEQKLSRQLTMTKYNKKVVGV